MIGIYKITNPKGKIYIGQSVDIEHRFYYYQTSWKWCKAQTKLYNSIDKHGWDNHIKEVIEECTLEQLNEREIYWINELDSVLNGLNLKYGGVGGKHSEQTKENIRQSLLGKKHSKERVENRSKKIKGQKRSDEVKQTMSDNKKGKDLTWGDKISESKKGKKFTQEHCNNIKNSTGKKIKQYDIQGNFIREFRNSTEAMEITGIKNDTISHCLRNKTKSAGGFIWKYSEIKIIPKIIQYTLDNIFVKEWESLKQIKLTNQYVGTSILNCCKGKIYSSGGFIWKYKEI